MLTPYAVILGDQFEQSLCEHVIVATDGEEIARLAKQYSKVTIYPRSEASAVDQAPTEIVLLEWLYQSDLDPDDIVVLGQKW